MIFKWNLKKILITTLIALVVASFSISAIVIYNNKKQNPEVQQTGAAGSANTFASTSFTISSDIDPESTNVGNWRDTYLRKADGFWGTNFDYWYDQYSTFTISTYEDFVMFALSVDFKDYSGKKVVMAKDINCGGWYLPAIGHTGWNLSNGDSCDPFKGTFDGQGHIISNFKLCNAKEDWGEYVLGLFYKLYDKAVVKNLKIKDATYQVDETGTTAVGGIVGDAEQGCTISQCEIENLKIEAYITTTVSYSSYQGMTYGTMKGEMYVAGIVGKLSGVAVTENLVIENCLVHNFTHDIYYNLDTVIQGYDFASNMNNDYAFGPAYRDTTLVGNPLGYFTIKNSLAYNSSSVERTWTFQSGKVYNPALNIIVTWPVILVSKYKDLYFERHEGIAKDNVPQLNNSKVQPTNDSYSFLGNLNDMAKMGETGSIWFYFTGSTWTSDNSTCPQLRQFLPWTTYKFYAEGNGSVSHSSIVIPTESLSVDTNSEIIVRNHYGYLVQAIGNPGHAWLAWESLGNKSYKATFTQADIQIEFCPAVVEYYKYNSGNYTLDSSKEDRLPATNADVEGKFVLTVKAGDSVEWVDDDWQQYCTFTIGDQEVVYNYDSIYGSQAYLNGNDFYDDDGSIDFGRNYRTTTLDVENNLWWKVNGSEYGGIDIIWTEEDLVLDSGGGWICQVRPRIVVNECTFSYSASDYTWISYGSTKYSSGTFGLGVYPGEGNLSFTRVSYTNGYDLVYINLDGTIKGRITTWSYSEYGDYLMIDKLQFYIADPKNGSPTNLETVDFKFSSSSYELTGNVNLWAYVKNLYYSVTFEQDPNSNATINVYKYKINLTTYAKTYQGDVTDEFIDASTGNIVLNKGVYIYSKLDYEMAIGTLADFPDVQQFVEIRYYFSHIDGTPLLMDQNVYTYEVVYTCNDNYFIGEHAFVNAEICDLSKTSISSIEEEYSILPEIITLATATISFSSGQLEGDSVNLRVNGGALQSSFAMVVYANYTQISASFNNITGVLTYIVSGTGISTITITYSVAPEYYIDDYSLDSGDPTARTLAVEEVDIMVSPTFVLKTYGGDFEGDKIQETVE